MIGIRDQYRPNVPRSIQQCKEAGITVRMVTGDNIATAIAISKEVGIISIDQVEIAKRNNEEIKEKIKDVSEDEIGKFLSYMTEKNDVFALEGEVFRKISGNLVKSYGENDEINIDLKNKSMFTQTVKNLKIIARASPEDKFLLVIGLKILKNIVAVTGDGTNDAPALRKAHVSFAMGIRGTDVAKAAADIILMDDSFSSIITACKYGRNVFESIQKFVQFQMTINVVAVFMTFIGAILLKDAPFNVIQMLWINLIMDSFASLALATESPYDSILKRKPIAKEASVFNTMMIINIASQSVYQMAVLIVLIYYGDVIFGVPSDRELEHFVWNDVNGYHFTILFQCFVLMNVFNSVNCRKIKRTDWNVFQGILGNWLYIFIQSMTLIVQYLLIQFAGRFMRVHPLSLSQHFWCLVIALFSLVIGWLVKLIPFSSQEEPVNYGDDQVVPKQEPIMPSFARSRNSITGSRLSAHRKA